MPTLSENNQKLYDELKKQIKALVAGTSGTTSTKFNVKDLNLSVNDVDLDTVIACLIMENPGDFFWWGRGTSYGYSGSTLTSVNLSVAKDYSASGNAGTYEVSRDLINGTNKAITNAQAIVKKYENESTYGKLDAYRKEICARVSYNSTAMGSGIGTAGSNPWELIWVFDDDPDTNVVCEGYSKAFQYLCNLTTGLGAECYTVSGTMSGGTGAGGHMWNIVRIGSKSYLVDITNCDDGTTGAPKHLFMVGGQGTRDTGYKCYNDKLTYKYYDTSDKHINQFDVFKGNLDILELSAEDYKDTSAPDSIEIVLEPAEEFKTTTGKPGFNVPEISVLGTPTTKEIILEAKVTKNSAEQTNQIIDWALSNSFGGITLTPDENNPQKATLTITNSTLSNNVTDGGYTLTVTAAHSTTSGEKAISVFTKTRAAKFVQILKDDVITQTDTLAPGSSATYTANVYDQYGVPMDGAEIKGVNGNSTTRPTATVTWEVTGGTDVTVNNGTVTVAADAVAGDYTVTAKAGSATADLKITVSQVAHTHTWSTTWSSDETNHWHICSNCDEKDSVAAHTWDAGTVTTAATCTTAGERTYTCTVCNKTKTEPVAMTAHDYEAKGDANGHWNECKTCKTKDGNAVAHTYGDPTVTKQPTCTEAGEQSKTCTVCSWVTTETGAAATGHNFDTPWSKDTANHWHVCKNCDATDTKTAHVWNEGLVTTPPTFEAAGVKTYTCTCGAEKTEPVDKKEHTYDTASWSHDESTHWHACTDEGYTDLKKDEAAHIWNSGVQTTAPTDTTEGVMTYTCTVCNRTRTESIGKTGHEYESGWTYDETNHWHKCTKNHGEDAAPCEEVSGKTAHTLGTPEITKQPTCIEAGSQKRTCSCGYVKTEEIPMTGEHNYSETWTSDATDHWHACTVTGCTAVSGKVAHTWDAGTVTTPATATTAGVKTFTCSVCSKTKTESIPALGTPVVPPAAHTHAWAAAWSSDADSHWHNCTASGCDVTLNSGKDGYAAHVYDNSADTECNVCGYVRTVTPITGFTVAFDANGGAVAPAAMVTNADGKLAALPVPVRTGYTFNGWYTAPYGGTYVTLNTVFVQNTTIYAQWTYITVPTYPYYPGTGGTGSTSSGSNNNNNNSTANNTSTNNNSNNEQNTQPPVSSNENTAPAQPAPAFVDVAPGEYYSSAVSWAVAMGITNGTTASTFSPDTPCTRGEIVTFLWRAAGSPKMNGTNPFGDINPGDYWYDAVLWAVSMGITSGTSDGTFSPNDTCTRGQTVTFLYRNANSPTVAASTAFADVASDAYYSNAVAWALANGITSGTSDTTFSPDAQCTRGQIVTFLYRDLAE